MGHLKKIEEIEEYRKTKIRYLYQLWAFIGITPAILAYYLIFEIGVNPIMLIYIAIGFAFMSLWAYKISNSQYRNRLKSQFMQALAEKHGLLYSSIGFFPLQNIQDHHILPKYDRSLVEDGFAGKVKHVEIKLQEIHLEDVYKNKKGEEIRTDVFKGLAILLELKKPLEFHTIAMPRNPARTWLKTNMSWQTRKFEKIGLSPKFEKAYDVISTDQVESRFIFDPAFMERFLELCFKIHAKTIMASFKDDELLILAESSKNHFELGHLFKPLTENDFTLVEEDLKIMSDIVEILKLNPHTGL